MTTPVLHTEGELKLSVYSEKQKCAGWPIGLYGYGPDDDEKSGPCELIADFDDVGNDEYMTKEQVLANATRLVHCWNHLPKVEAERDRLLVALEYDAEILDHQASKCERWADESTSSGLSTHLVQAHKEMAQDMINRATAIRTALAKSKESTS